MTYRAKKDHEIKLTEVAVRGDHGDHGGGGGVPHYRVPSP